MTDYIKSNSNKKIKYLKKLLNKNKRKSEAKFVLEGYRIIKEALLAEAKFDNIFITPQFEKTVEGKDIRACLNEPQKINIIGEKLLEELTDTVNPQGIMAIVKENKNNLVDLNDAQLILVLDQIQDPGNMGTIIRTAVAAGVDGLIALKGSVDIYNLKVLRATMGAIFSIPIMTGISLEEFLSFLDNNKGKWQILGTALAGAKDYYQLDYEKPCLLIIGNEARGVRKKILQQSEQTIKIPIFGQIESLNAAVATGIILYEITLKKRLGK